jgi:hypothetical protein
MHIVARSLAAITLVSTIAYSVNASAGTGEITTGRTANGATRSATRTGANGKTMTHDGSVSYNAANQSFSRNSSTTLPDGKTMSSSGTITKTADGSVRDSSFTGPNGQTKSSQVTRNRSTTSTPQN